MMRETVSRLSIKLSFLLLILMLGLTPGTAKIWQWSVPMGNGRAFLWIPPNCQHVKAVLVGQHNMIEQGILEHPHLRKVLAETDCAEVWVAPPYDGVFRFDQGAGDRFTDMMNRLAAESGYTELAYCPIIPMGHSACASYPWNFAAWNPQRTLAILSIHGDAPLSNRTGSGKPNPDWGDRNIDFIPALMVMGEYEWWDDRLAPALAFDKAHPHAPIAFLAEPGSGHYDYSDSLVDFIGMFIKKAMATRLPANSESTRAPVTLKPIEPSAGWLVERGYRDKKRTVNPASFAQYTGSKDEAFWAFDQEMAEAIQNYSADQVGKKPQLLGFSVAGEPFEKNSGEPVNLKFMPDPDGITFHLNAGFVSSVVGGNNNTNPARWTGFPVGTPLGHAQGPIVISKIVGPVIKLDADTFQVALDKNAETTDGRLHDIWFVASQSGDSRYKSIYQQGVMHLPENKLGLDQHIDFAEIQDVAVGTKSVELSASSDQKLPLKFYVREGPAEIAGNQLVFSAIPPISKFPIKVTVVAWQFGRSTDPQIKAAAPVEQTFTIYKNK